MCQIQIFVFWELDWRKYVAVNFFTLFPTHIWVKINLTCWWHTLKSKGQGETSWFLSWTAGGEILVYYLVLCTVGTEIEVNPLRSETSPFLFWLCIISPAGAVSENVFLHCHLLPPERAFRCRQLDLLPRQPGGNCGIFSWSCLSPPRWSPVGWLFSSPSFSSSSIYSTPSKPTHLRFHISNKLLILICIYMHNMQ